MSRAFLDFSVQEVQYLVGIIGANFHLIKPVIRIAQFMLAILLFQACCHAELEKLPADKLRALRDAQRFHEIHETTNLPPIIMSFCVDGHGRIADVESKWEATDAIHDSTLPQSHLIWAVTDGYYSVVHFEKGGRGHNFYVLVASLKKGDPKPNFVWHGVGPRLENFKAFLDAASTKSWSAR